LCGKQQFALIDQGQQYAHRAGQFAKLGRAAAHHSIEGRAQGVLVQQMARAVTLRRGGT
jgi:hypothetical protein